MPTIYKTETGKLVRYGGGMTEVLAPWPAPMGWCKGPKDSCWRHVRPDIHLPASDITRLIGRQVSRIHEPSSQEGMDDEKIAQLRRSQQNRLNFLYWAAHIPREVRKPIARFGNRQWHLLSMVARCGQPALDLLHSNPALAYMLASNWVFHKPVVCQPMRSIRSLLRRGRNQRDIMEWLGFPPSQSMRRILARIVPASCTITRLLYLLDCCRNPRVQKTLCHLNRINASVLRIVTDPELRGRVGFDVIERLSRKRGEDRTPRLARLLMDMDRMCYDLGVEPRKIWHLEDIERIHDAMMENLNAEEVDDFSPDMDIEFPPPPLPGTELIEPICDLRTLREEGFLQKHCVSAYGRKIAVNRTVYIYRILEPERATLSLTRHGKNWHLGELKGFRNDSVSAQTWKQVREWYASATLPVLE